MRSRFHRLPEVAKQLGVTLDHLILSFLQMGKRKTQIFHNLTNFQLPA
jgi:hypothetical protein